MIAGRRVLAVVPARGGSKGIPLKNLRTVGGVPLVARVGHVLAALPEIDRAVVSTDHEEIARIAEGAGIAAPFRRPDALSGDRVGDVDVLVDAIRQTEMADGLRYEIVLMLQPTSPMRRPEHVRACLAMLAAGDWDAVWTVSPTDSKAHPLKQLTVDDDRLGYHDPRGAEIVARQQLAPLYHRNGIAYAFTRECLVEHRSLTGRDTGALVLDGHFVSIDTEWDIELTEFLLTRNGWGVRSSSEKTAK